MTLWKPWRFTLILLAGMIGYAVIVALLNQLTSVSISSSAGSGVAIVIASLLEGTFFARRSETDPETGPLWRAAFGMTAIAIAVNGVLAVVFAPMLMPGILARELVLILALVLLLFAIIGPIAVRFGFRQGVKAERKRIARANS